MPPLTIILDQSDKAYVKDEGHRTDGHGEIQGRPVPHDLAGGLSNLIFNRGGKPQSEAAPVEIQGANHRPSNALLVPTDGVTGNDLSSRVYKVGTEGKQHNGWEDLSPIGLVNRHGRHEHTGDKDCHCPNGQDPLRSQPWDHPGGEAGSPCGADNEGSPSHRELQRGPVPDLGQPQHLVPDHGPDGHVVEQDYEKQRQEGGGLENIEGHDRLCGIVLFPQKEASE